MIVLTTERIHRGIRRRRATRVRAGRQRRERWLEFVDWLEDKPETRTAWARQHALYRVATGYGTQADHDLLSGEDTRAHNYVVMGVNEDGDEVTERVTTGRAVMIELPTLRVDEFERRLAACKHRLGG